MEDAAIHDPAGFWDLSQTQRIYYLQTLWDRIAEESGEIPVPESHIKLAHERLIEYRQDPSQARPAMDALDRLAERER